MPVKYPVFPEFAYFRIYTCSIFRKENMFLNYDNL